MEAIKILLLICWCIQFQCRTVNGVSFSILETAKTGKYRLNVRLLIKKMGIDARKPVSGICEQQRRRPARASRRLISAHVKYHI